MSHSFSHSGTLCSTYPVPRCPVVDVSRAPGVGIPDGPRAPGEGMLHAPGGRYFSRSRGRCSSLSCSLRCRDKYSFELHFPTCTAGMSSWGGSGVRAVICPCCIPLAIFLNTLEGRESSFWRRHVMWNVLFIILKKDFVHMPRLRYPSFALWN